MKPGFSRILTRLKERWLILVASFFLIVSILVLVQDVSGILWKLELPLPDDPIQKRGDDTFRFPLAQFDERVREHLGNGMQILENGRTLNQVRSRNRLSRYPAGCYAWTESNLWVKPRSGDPEGLVARIPLGISGRTKAIMFGATLLALFGVFATTAERKFLGRFLTDSATFGRRLVYRVSEIASRHFDSRPYWNDFFALGLLVLVAAALNLPLMDRTAHSQDGFLLSYLLETGDLLPYNVNEVKEPGRPFVGLGWYIAVALGGGSVSGYYVFLCSCLLFSAMLVYGIVRLLVPKQPVWALLAGMFKLIWIANFEISNNSGLAIYFAESLFWLAVFLYTLLCVRRRSQVVIEVLALSLMVACLVIVVGTYQTAWPLVLLVPLSLVGLGVIQWNDRRAYVLFSLWYLPAIAMMAWCASLSYSYVSQVSPSLQEVFQRVLIGMWAATGESLLYPFASGPHFTSGSNAILILLVLLFAFLLIWFCLKSFPELQKQSGRRMVRTLLVLVFISLLILIGSVVPPSLNYSPEFGSRHMHWPAIGTIVAVVAALAGLCRVKVPVGGALSLVLAFVLFSAMIHQKYDDGIARSERSFSNRRFWEDLIEELPKVEEGTVVLMEGPPVGVALSDIFGTWVFRALTETQTTFFVSEAVPEFDRDNETYEVASLVNLDLEGEPASPVGENSYFEYPVFPTILDEPRVFQIPSDRVVWVTWNFDSRRLLVDREQSATDRMLCDVPSVFGDTLFPRETAEKNRARVSF